MCCECNLFPLILKQLLEEFLWPSIADHCNLSGIMAWRGHQFPVRFLFPSRKSL